jgi:hypothetical protein
LAEFYRGKFMARVLPLLGDNVTKLEAIFKWFGQRRA